MQGDGHINSLETHLDQFNANNQTSQQSLQVLLKDYSQLLEDYKTLKKSQEANGVKNGDNGFTDSARNPYVLVLIDGNGYIFNDELVKDKEEGGMRAARMLDETVKAYLRESLPAYKNARVIVRIYADVTNLSKQLAKSKLIGLEKRSLAPFTAGFTRAINFFDFTDALDEDGTRFKLREMFKLGAEDSACSHILFAGCHDTSYLPQLVPFSGLRNKITLVQGAGFSSEFHQFSLNLTQFPTIFRWSGLSPLVPGIKPSTLNVAAHIKVNKVPREQVYASPTPRHEDRWEKNTMNGFGAHSAFSIDETLPPTPNGFGENKGTMSWRAKNETPQKYEPPQKNGGGLAPCKYFQKGFCRFGQNCKFAHGPKNSSVLAGTKFASSNDNAAPEWITIDRSAISSTLPTSTVPGFIPLNKDTQRLDTSLKPPGPEDWVAYNDRFSRQKPCNAFHLQRICTAFNCPFDHSELEPSVRRTLEYVVKGSPCPRKSGCRTQDCQYGHLCQRVECTGQTKGCRMKPEMHNVDPKLASMVPAELDELAHDTSTEGGMDVESQGDDGSGW